MWSSERKSGDVEIEPEEWISFLDGFSRQHEGWLATIEVATAGGKLTEVVNQRLKRCQYRSCRRAAASVCRGG